MHAIETRGLSHRFGPGEPVLRDVDLAVAPGSIYGFLGPNGAGKTTTLRLVLGLLRHQQGTIRIFGDLLAGNRVALLRRIGSSIESPSLYGHLTAAENLEVWRGIFRAPPQRTAEALRLVGLSETGSKRADQFSLGMRQRLGIAVALLHEPSLLVLDEPTNGLDPHGILEMRDLLTALNRQHGMTILVSSHILSEVEKLITHVGIIHRGALLFQGTLGALVAQQQESSFTAVDTDDNVRAVAILAEQGWDGRVERGRITLRPLAPADAAAVTATLVARGVMVHEITTVRKDLERIFLDMVGAG
jgi:ABC-2 type transport system ATP-binding protein